MAEQRKIAGVPRNVAIAGGVGAVGVLGYLWWRHRQAAADAASQDSSSDQGGYSGAAAPVPALAYGANADEIIATVNGPSVGQGDDDDGKPPASKPKPKPKPGRRPGGTVPAGQPTSGFAGGAGGPVNGGPIRQAGTGPSPAPTRGPSSRPARPSPARKRRRRTAAA